MTDEELLDSLELDDSLEVRRVLAQGPGGMTELVCPRLAEGPEGPLYVRKRIPRALANEPAWQAARTARSAHLPTIRWVYWLPDELVVVYDYVPGASLSQVVQSSGPMPASRAAGIMQDVCKAAEALHAVGVVHRDISPANVIVADGTSARDGRDADGADADSDAPAHGDVPSAGAYLIDLGIARTPTQGARRDTTLLGTWGYAAPEQYGFAQTDARSDVYALGRVFGFLLTGRAPDDASYARALADRTLVSRQNADVIACACAFEPSDRYQSASELAHAIRRANLASRPSQVALLASECRAQPRLVRAGLKVTRGWRRALSWAFIVIGILTGAFGLISTSFILARPDDGYAPASALLMLVVTALACDLVSLQPLCIVLGVGAYGRGGRWWTIYLRHLAADVVLGVGLALALVLAVAFAAGMVSVLV